MISRALKIREVNYAKHERELLEIVLLNSLRPYLYGRSDIGIYTDHQPLIFAVSDQNPNSNIKKDNLVRFFPTTEFRHYKNGVADAVNKGEQKEILTVEHKKALTAAQENISRS